MLANMSNELFGNISDLKCGQRGYSLSRTVCQNAVSHDTVCRSYNMTSHNRFLLQQQRDFENLWKAEKVVLGTIVQSAPAC